MACTNCDKNIWKQKLGRCKRCMWLNFFLLLASAVLSYFMVQSQPKSVQTIAALFALFFSALLMLSHTVAFIYYRFTKARANGFK
ncbi:DUF3624 domain-containing protein [Psychromonas hadalis]|uniref:DUF3624 domain-containing protein n=1 Tax=Psychromonas hadalis TaxID=211669 RepID=UPI0003B5FBC1|nr:DUF3624 domain-containing protein [Psychromonas hadalis]